MALVLRINQKSDIGGPAAQGGDRLAIMVGEIDFDSSYPTGGEALDLSGWIKSLLFIQFESMGGYVFRYDHTNSKVMAYWGDNDNAAHAVLAEVTDTTDLSALVGVKFLAVGV